MSRFAEPQDAAFRRLNDSIAFDRRLGPYDIRQSRAHAAMLARQGIISESDRDQLRTALDQVDRELGAGTFAFADHDEDIHTAIERRVTEIAGAVGGKLHTARSRNDQVATDLALFVRDHGERAVASIGSLAKTLLGAAERHLDWPMPGYTHLQRAQPVYLSHHLLAYVWMLFRDRDRFAGVLDGTGSLPLGAGALAGVNFDTDRAFLARELGFRRPAENSIDAVSNRDFVLDYLAAAATCATHLSRLGAEIVLWSSEEFGFCEVSDAWASGSSIMPQKKNPDAAELLRAKAPRIAAHLVALHGVMHGLPLTYNKDMQEDKEHLFDTVDTLELCLAAAEGMIGSISFRRDRLACAAGDELLAATDVADLLVRRGVPFRQSHAIVAGLVRLAVEQGVSLSELSPEQLVEQSPLLDDAFYARAARRRVAGVEGVRGRDQPGPRARAARAGAGRAVKASFYERPVLEVARDLIGCVVSHGDTAGVIVETEAYHHSEPACHAFVGLTARTQTLFGPPGRAYVYRSYGIHACLNAVAEPLRGRRGGADPGARAGGGDRADASAPARRAPRGAVLGSGEADAGAGDRSRPQRRPTSSTGPVLISDRPQRWREPLISADRRIGITKAAELPWRFCAAGSPFLSRPVREAA